MADEASLCSEWSVNCKWGLENRWSPFPRGVGFGECCRLSGLPVIPLLFLRSSSFQRRWHVRLEEAAPVGWRRAWLSSSWGAIANEVSKPPPMPRMVLNYMYLIFLCFLPSFLFSLWWLWPTRLTGHQKLYTYLITLFFKYFLFASSFYLRHLLCCVKLIHFILDGPVEVETQRGQISYWNQRMCFIVSCKNLLCSLLWERHTCRKIAFYHEVVLHLKVGMLRFMSKT